MALPVRATISRGRASSMVRGVRCRVGEGTFSATIARARCGALFTDAVERVAPGRQMCYT